MKIGTDGARTDPKWFHRGPGYRDIFGDCEILELWEPPRPGYVPVFAVVCVLVVIGVAVWVVCK